MRVRGSFRAGTAPVYNLTVEGPHEYYAEGVLVGNCDALRYYVMGRPAPAKDEPMIAYPPGTVGYLKRQALMEREPAGRILGMRNRSRRGLLAR